MQWKKVRGGITAPGGYRAAGTGCGIKSKGVKDLAVLYSDIPASWSGAFTTNSFAAAPVVLTRDLLRRRRPLRGVIVNSGNANAATGKEGIARAQHVIDGAAGQLGLDPKEVVMASTGIIGKQLPHRKILRALPEAVDNLSRRGGKDAAEAIMTTDSFPKQIALELTAAGGRGRIRIGGMAKGAGMIRPDMATMLAFLTTDAGLPMPLLRSIVRDSVEKTFNRISIDGDCSTNDTVLVLANGTSGVVVPEKGKVRRLFEEGVREVCRWLAEMIVRDGEGATKYVEVEVTGARTDGDAYRAALAVADSTLVKTAWFGKDLNWGRMVAAVGYSGAKVDPGKVALYLNGAKVVEKGAAVSPALLKIAAKQMNRKELRFRIDLGIGRGRDRILTCDLSLQYVRENALYTT